METSLSSFTSHINMRAGLDQFFNQSGDRILSSYITIKIISLVLKSSLYIMYRVYEVHFCTQFDEHVYREY